jgi:hypothetical protein
VANPERPAASTTHFGARFVAASAVAGVVVAFPAAWLWSRVADPPAGELTRSGLFLGEVQLNQQSEVTLWFLAVGFVVGLLAGLTVGWLGRRAGVVAVVGVVVLCAVAAALTALLGIKVFGPDQKAEAASASLGDEVTSKLTIGTDVAYLGWPIGGVTGTCLVILWWQESANGPSRRRAWSTVVAHPSSTRDS